MATEVLQVSPELHSAIQHIAERDGVEVETVLKEALRLYAESNPRDNVRSEVVANFQDSLEKNRELYRMLAQ